MNNTLSLPRLGMLMRKHWLENLSFYVLATVALFGMMAIVLVFWVAVDGPHYQEASLYVIYLVGLIIAGCIFAASSFNMLGDKAKGGWWLSLPASHLEKLITVIVFTTGLFFVVYSACFFILKPIAIAYVNSRMQDAPQFFNFQKADEAGEFWKIFYIFLFVFFAVQALYLMGSAFFSKHAFIKTTIIAAAIIFLLIYYTYRLGEWMVPKNVNTGNLMEPSKTQIDLMLWTVKLVWAPLFWVITWFRLKEKEL